MPPRNKHRPVKTPGARKTAGRRDAGVLPEGTDEPYRLLFERNPSPMWILADGTLRFLEANEAAVKLYGWSREEFRRMTIKDVLPPEEVYRLVQKLRRQRSSRAVFVSQSRHWTKNRSVMDVEVAIRGIPFQGRDALLTMISDITERTRAEEALRQTRQREHLLADVLEHATVPLGIGAADGRLLMFNQAFADLTGYSRAELEQKQLSWNTDLTPPEWRAAEAKHLALARRTRQPVRYEKEYVRKNGTRVPIELFVQPFVDPDDASFHYRSFVTDITARKQTEEALRRSVERLKRAEGIGHLGSWELDLLSNQLTWSDEVYRIFGLRPQQFAATYEAFLAHVHPDDRAAVDAAFSGSLREGRRTYEIEHRIVRGKTGEVRTVLEKCEHFRDATGRIVRSVGMVHDITERKRAEEVVRESEAQVRLALSAAKAASWTWDIKTNRTVWSPEYYALYGFKSKVRPTLQNWLRRIHPADRKTVQELVQRTLKDRRKEFLFEYRIRCPDRGERWIANQGSVIYSARGKPVVATGINLDITERKQAEFTLKEFTATLERRVAERTADLRHTNRTLRMLTECGEVLVRATDESELLQAICRLVVEVGGYRMAWVGYAEEDAAKSVRPVARAGFDAGYLDTVKLTWADNERGRGPTGTAIRTGQPVIARNIHTHPAFGPWRQAALDRRYAASAALPLKGGEGMLGALMVYAAEPGTFDASEVGLLAQLARDLAYGISALRTRAEHWRAELARREAQQRLVNIVEFLPDATFVIDQDNRLIAWNRACETMTGVKKEAVLGSGDYAYAEAFYQERRPMLIDLVNRRAPELEALFQSFRREGEAVYGEAFFPSLRNGQGAHLWGAAAPLLDQNGNRSGAIEVIRDVTPLKETEQALRQSEQQFRLIMDNLADLVALLDVHGHRLYNSPSYRQILGDPDLLRGTDSFAEVHPDDRDRVSRAFRDTVRTGVGQRLEYRMIDREGRTRHIESQGSVIRDEQNRVSRVLVVSRDVTARKRAEEELHRLSAHLLQVRDSERRHLARELHDTTAQHLAALTLNLGSLKGHLAKASTPAHALCCDCIQLANQAAQEIRTHSYLLHPPLLEVMGLAGAVEDYAQGLSARSGVTIELQAPADFGRLPEDMELALFRVIQESLSNVLKHSGSSRARIRLTRRDSLVTLEVQDMGHGIPDDKLARIKARSGGSGVGIGGMHERLRLLGGWLDIESGPTGTTVRASVSLSTPPPVSAATA